MPPRNPTLEDVPLPNVQGARPVASYDVSAWGQGAQSIAKGMQTLGGDIQKGAQDVAEVQLYRERQAVENGKIGLVTQLLNNRAQFEDSNHPNVKTQWDAANKASYDKYRAQIPAPAGTALADHFDAHADQLLAHENLLSTKRQRAVDSDFAVSDISSTLNTLRKSVKFNPGETPDATIDAAISGIHTKIDNAVARNLLTAEHGELLKQRSAKAVADQFVADMVENHPDEYKKLRGTWTPQAKTAKAFGTDPLRQSDSAASASTSAQQAPQDGAAPSLAPSTSRIAETVNNGETQNGRTINVRSLGQIARDTGG